MRRLLPVLAALALCGCRPPVSTSTPRPQAPREQPFPSEPAPQHRPPTKPPASDLPPDPPLAATQAPPAAERQEPPVTAPQPPAPAAPASKTANITRDEFRQKVMTFQNLAPGFRGGSKWNGKNFGPGDGTPKSNSYRVAIFMAQDFIDAFGPPEKSTTKGTSTRWAWKCRDGWVGVIHEGYSVGSKKIEFMGVSDY